MAKLYFYYAAMNAGKSTTLIADYNYRERGMETMLWTAAHDDRAGAGVIGSRVALSAPCPRTSQEGRFDIGQKPLWAARWRPMRL